MEPSSEEAVHYVNRGLEGLDDLPGFGGDYSTGTTATMPFAACGGPPSRSGMKQRNA